MHSTIPQSETMCQGLVLFLAMIKWHGVDPFFSFLLSSFCSSMYETLKSHFLGSDRHFSSLYLLITTRLFFSCCMKAYKITFSCVRFIWQVHVTNSYARGQKYKRAVRSKESMKINYLFFLVHKFEESCHS